MPDPLVSVVMPCRNAAGTVDCAVRSVLSSTLPDLELLVVDDASEDGTAAALAALARADARVRVVAARGRGVSAARNAALDAARGTFVLFADADDVMAADCCEKTVSALRRTGADYCLFGYAAHRADAGGWREVLPKRAYDLGSNDEIVAEYLPHIFGYSLDDVRAWYGGRPLFAAREMAQVWRAAFRRELIERRRVRFDESIALNEDAMFNAEFLLGASRMTSLPEVLYHHVESEFGQQRAVARSPAFFANKARLLERRERLDVLSGGRLTGQYAGSCVLSLLEMAAAARRIRGAGREARRAFVRFLRDPVCREALRRFPLSARRPLVAAGVAAFRLLALVVR